LVARPTLFCAAGGNHFEWAGRFRGGLAPMAVMTGEPGRARSQKFAVVGNSISMQQFNRLHIQKALSACSPIFPPLYAILP